MIASMPPRKKRLAKSSHPSIEAITGGHYHFHSRNDAEATLTILAQHFHIHSEKPFTLWVEGFSLTEDERKLGYKGHFATIRITRTAKRGSFTLKATKESIPLAQHPGRKRPSYPHPDWRHPLLKAIKAGMVYPSLEDAQAVLSALHNDFPRATIPGAAKLHIALYAKPTITKEDPKPSPISKYLLTVESTQEGTFRINATQKPPPKPRRTPPPTREAPIPQGRFTARETLKRSRRPRS